MEPRGRRIREGGEDGIAIGPGIQAGRRAVRVDPQPLQGPKADFIPNRRIHSSTLPNIGWQFE